MTRGERIERALMFVRRAYSATVGQDGYRRLCLEAAAAELELALREELS